MTKRKKMNKEQRLAKRQENADKYNLAFSHGFDMGVQVGIMEGLKMAKMGVAKI